MIYLNNAATSYPKPPSVVDATIGALRAMPASALRSSLADDQQLPTLRERLGELFHIADTNRIYLASGATDALNRVIGGLDAQPLSPPTTTTVCCGRYATGEALPAINSPRSHPTLSRCARCSTTTSRNLVRCWW